jgi:hypothetical protein
VSIYWDVLAAVRAKVVGLSLPGVMPGQVVIRKKPAFVQEVDQQPLVCLCPRAERPAGEHFGNELWMDYPVIVATIRENKLALHDVQRILDSREDIRLALHKPYLDGAPTVFDSDYNPEPVFDLGALANAYDVSLQEFVFRSNETRSA